MSKADDFFRRKAEREGWNSSRRETDKNVELTSRQSDNSQAKTARSSADDYFRQKALKEGWQDGDNTNKQK